MKVFTYKQYIKYIHSVRLNAILELNEESNSYLLEKGAEGTLLEEMLKNRRDVASLINRFLKPIHRIKPNNLVDCTNHHSIDQTEVVYRLKSKNIFFLMKFQLIIDEYTPYKILKSCIDIIQKNKKCDENIIIVPTIIYITKKKFHRNSLLDLEYNLINFRALQLKK